MRIRARRAAAILIPLALGVGSRAFAREAGAAAGTDVRDAVAEPADPDDADDIRDDDDPNDVGQEGLDPVGAPGADGSASGGSDCEAGDSDKAD
jgi:hypothetical protein